MNWGVRTIRLLEREGHRLKLPLDMPLTHAKPHDVIQFVDPPIYEVDPRTMKSTEKLQEFRLGADAVALAPLEVD